MAMTATTEIDEEHEDGEDAPATPAPSQEDGEVKVKAAVELDFDGDGEGAEVVVDGEDHELVGVAQSERGEAGGVRHRGAVEGGEGGEGKLDQLQAGGGGQVG